MKNPNQGLAQKEFERVISVLKKNGYSDAANLDTFWTMSEDVLKEKVYGKNVDDETFSLQARWYSEVGQVIQISVRDYINSKVAAFSKRQINSVQVGVIIPPKEKIDFSDWKYTFKGQTYSAKEYNKYIPVRGDGNTKLLDFRGISLIDMQIHDCDFINCSFNYAFFDFSNINYSSFTNTSLVRTSFYNCNLISDSLIGNSSMASAYLDGAVINEIDKLNNAFLSVPFIYSSISYSALLGLLFTGIFKNYNPINFLPKRKHTVFLSNQTEGLTSPETKELKEYINWFQSVTNRLYNFKALKGRRKLGFWLAVISTKYWSSFAVLGGTAFLLDLIFAFIFTYNSTSFNNLDIPDNCPATFIKAFYYSTVTFMTLGYGDIFPKFWGGQILVIIEVTLGYTVLGLFVYLVSRKVDKIY